MGNTSGWCNCACLQNKGVNMIPGCSYTKIDDAGIHLTIGDKTVLFYVDHVIVCAGQEPMRDLVEGLNKPHHLIGGADVAAELDAKRAIDQGVRLAVEL